MILAVNASAEQSGQCIDKHRLWGEKSPTGAVITAAHGVVCVWGVCSRSRGFCWGAPQVVVGDNEVQRDGLLKRSLRALVAQGLGAMALGGS